MQQDFSQHVNTTVKKKNQGKPIKCQYLLYGGQFLQRYFFFPLKNKHTGKSTIYIWFLSEVLQTMKISSLTASFFP